MKKIKMRLIKQPKKDNEGNRVVDISDTSYLVEIKSIKYGKIQLETIYETFINHIKNSIIIESSDCPTIEFEDEFKVYSDYIHISTEDLKIFKKEYKEFKTYINNNVSILSKEDFINNLMDD